MGGLTAAKIAAKMQDKPRPDGHGPANRRAGRKSNALFPFHAFSDGLQNITLQALTGGSGGLSDFPPSVLFWAQTDIVATCIISVQAGALLFTDRHVFTF